MTKKVSPKDIERKKQNGERLSKEDKKTIAKIVIENTDFCVMRQALTLCMSLYKIVFYTGRKESIVRGFVRNASDDMDYLISCPCFGCSLDFDMSPEEVRELQERVLSILGVYLSNERKELLTKDGIYDVDTILSSLTQIERMLALFYFRQEIYSSFFAEEELRKKEGEDQ